MPERGHFYPDTTGGDPERKVEVNPEIIVEPEQDITPESIWEDSYSDRAKDLRGQFAENKAKRQLVIKKGCIDARRHRLQATRTLHYDTIAAAGEPHEIWRAIENGSVSLVIIELHHGPEIKKVSPTECGGRDAKGKQMGDPEKADPYGDGLAAFITKEVLHHDVVVQGCRTAARTAKITEKPVAVVTENHRTGKLKLVAVYQKQGNILQQQSAIVDQDLLYGEYKPEELYVEGIPEIPLDLVENDVVREYLRGANRELEVLQKADPDYEKKHTAHNPDMTKISTDISSAGLIIPEIASHPGSIVRITMPRREKIDESGHSAGRLRIEDIKKAWQQAEYIVSNAVKGHGDLMKPFSKMKTIFIALRRYEKAEELALDFMSRMFANDWLILPDRRIIIAQTKLGEINNIGELKWDVKQGRATNPQTITYGERVF